MKLLGKLLCFLGLHRHDLMSGEGPYNSHWHYYRSCSKCGEPPRI